MLKYASITKAGGRTCNEDDLKISSVGDRHCFVVCDGLGGHDSGAVAARIAGNAFVNELFYAEDLSGYLLTAFDSAQSQIRLRQKEAELHKHMKTTAVCLAMNETTAYVGHVGDSRFYGFKKDGTYMRTLDHSVPQLLVQSHTIIEADIRNHPNRNMLLKVIGDDCDEQLCEVSDPLSLNEFSAFLLCSDGFWELITEDEMLAALQVSDSPQEWLDKMTAIVESNGQCKEMDNYTAIAVVL